MRKNLCERDKNSRSRTETQAGTITLGGKITEWQKKNEPLETKENTIVEGWRGKKGFCLSSE